jgi:hypothetical protein
MVIDFTAVSFKLLFLVFMTLSSCFLFYFLNFYFCFSNSLLRRFNFYFVTLFIELFLSMYFSLPCYLLCKYMNKNKYHAIHSTMNFIMFLIFDF